MKAYKQRLLESLMNEGWELVEVDDYNYDWWCDEHWLIRSIRENRGLEILIFFLVDPQWDSSREKEQGIWEIAAVNKFPSGWVEASKGIAVLPLSTRKFEQKLQIFISSLSHYRINIIDENINVD